jgi:hypothetical protein
VAEETECTTRQDGALFVVFASQDGSKNHKIKLMSEESPGLGYEAKGHGLILSTPCHDQF